MVHSSPTSYEIHDNGGRPFVVDVYPHRVVIVRLDSQGNRREIVHETVYETIWLGDNLLSLPRYVEKGTDIGNTILLRVHTHTYLFIGSEVYQFTLRGDTLMTYYSPIGNSDVPYPYALGGDYAYFFLDKKRVPLGVIDVSQDGYQQFYRSVANQEKEAFTVEVMASAQYE